MSKTATEVRNRALWKLGRVPRGSTATGAIADDMDDAYTQVYAELNLMGLVTWASTDSIPDEFVEPIVNLMCLRRSEGISQERLQKLIVDAGPRGELAKLDISALISGTYQDPREYTDY